MIAILAKEIEAKEAFFPTILPNILRAMLDGMKKFEKYTKKFNNDALNTDAKEFQENFENWVIDYIRRFMISMKNLSEVKNLKKLISPNDLIEIDYTSG